MNITQCKYKIRCEMGACGKRAAYTLTPGRTGVRACLHICADCLRELSELGAKALGERDGKSAGEVEA